MPFLDDAHRLGLLRAVGPYYQFRHSEFQDRVFGRPLAHQDNRRVQVPWQDSNQLVTTTLARYLGRAKAKAS